MSQRFRRPARDRGTATVEFALVVPLLLMLVFGIIDFARMASDRIALTAAARAGAQALAVTADPDTARTAANNAFPGGGLSLVSTSACPANPSATATAAVTVQYGFVFATPIGLLPGIGGGTHAMRATGAVPCRG